MTVFNGIINGKKSILAKFLYKNMLVKLCLYIVGFIIIYQTVSAQMMRVNIKSIEKVLFLHWKLSFDG